MEETAPTAKQYDEPPFTKRILVTGGAGFIGSHVVIYLAKHYPDYYIVNLDSLDYCSCVRNVHSAISSCGSEHETQNSTENAEEEEEDEVCERLRGSFCEPGDDLSDEYLNTLPKNYKFIHGSITGADLVGYILKTERIDTIMHFAAQSHVDNSFGNSIEFNEVYGEGRPDSTPMTEDHVLEPTNPYAATKAGAEFLVKTYHRSFGLPTIITRSNNVYGPHQYPEKLIPKFINQILRDRPVTIHGDGKHTRNYLYISDVVAAFDLILHEGKVGEVYNIGGEQELSNKEVTIDLLDIMKPHLVGAEKAKMITHVEDRPFNDHRYIIDATKIRRLGWKEKVPWREGLRKTVKWCCRYGHRFTNVDHALEPHPIAFKKSYKINLP
ncbi:hypothetical protein BBO99_00005166 [Phytophthora kernoviae]|uniref:NAD(P)-binding domain-containing protein n=2 Tax=Phytophthora kernoviae TaxID=325452 RepID=A0A421GPH4_9STRA|nr:hypothetical protein G195_005985 [Phytophthora kernoviae 00238/432]KAG2519887.1 hypothetical protein JM16_005208 [Phytophthora kernoviae]KAG2526156.1 hypothetical protein JM18_004310 [Phytophthora kernoviae]RLN21062.1 hypothetical protein BBI17_005428 [Phytophthora kernoviae]RLN79564.1 hypothetical protein BBO99_00005166 [Phytophthora kernoviae]